MKNRLSFLLALFAGIPSFANPFPLPVPAVVFPAIHVVPPVATDRLNYNNLPKKVVTEEGTVTEFVYD